MLLGRWGDSSKVAISEIGNRLASTRLPVLTEMMQSAYSTPKGVENDLMALSTQPIIG